MHEASRANHAADVSAIIDALETEGLVSLLAEPNLTALSGETANFLVGGEFPIPVVDRQGAASVEFKAYGVSLAFTPTVLSGHRINLRVMPEVSSISSVGAVTLNGVNIPALATRRASTSVELASGQSFAIAGLLQADSDQNVNKFPGLADLPILGTLFRSTAFNRRETELVVIVTPYVVRPVSSGALLAPTDGFEIPDDFRPHRARADAPSPASGKRAFRPGSRARPGDVARWLRDQVGGVRGAAVWHDVEGPRVLATGPARGRGRAGGRMHAAAQRLQPGTVSQDASSALELARAPGSVRAGLGRAVRRGAPPPGRISGRGRAATGRSLARRRGRQGPATPGDRARGGHLQACAPTPRRGSVSSLPVSAVSARDVHLLLGRPMVRLPACPDWSRLSGSNPGNLRDGNHGCATVTNLGLMAADPSDLVQGRRLAPGDGHVLSTAVWRYRTDQVKNPEKPAQGAVAPAEGAAR